MNQGGGGVYLLPWPKKKKRPLQLCINQNTVLITQYHEIGTVARLTTTSRIVAPKRNQA